jgi:hypothetical protein
MAWGLINSIEQERVLNALNHLGVGGPQAIAKQADLDEQYVKTTLAKLLKRGLILKMGHGLYIINSKTVDEGGIIKKGEGKMNLIMIAEKESFQINHFKLQVGTTAPEGGDGSLTYFKLKDEGGTNWKINAEDHSIEIKLAGDSECDTFIDILEKAVMELKKQRELNNSRIELSF